MSKRVNFATKPSTADRSPSAEQWVSGSVAPPAQEPARPEPMKRLTIDIPASLHAQVKSKCALMGVKMADEVRELLEKRFLDVG
jgi:hypothetical protein